MLSPSACSVFGSPSLLPSLMDRPEAHSATRGERDKLQMLLHPPNEEPTPPGWLWRESAVICLVKPLQKLLQHPADELMKADFLAEDK